jgi:sulfite exporter TauE/SafE
VETINIFGALLLGLMGAGHCMAMCGGIISTLSLSSPSDNSKNKHFLLYYQVGRIFSYTVIGIVAGSFGLLVNEISPIPILKALSGVLLIGMAFYISKIWMALSCLEKMGKRLWDKISPLSKNLLPLKNWRQAFILGTLWGWLPCGLVYTSLAFSLSIGSSIESGLFMMAFGLGTLPATLFIGVANNSLKRYLNSTTARYLISFCFLLWGVYSLYSLFVTPLAHHH